MATENVLQDVKVREEKKTLKILGSGSLAQGFAGMGAMALAIIGLAGPDVLWMLAISTILAAVALMFVGGAIGARFSALASDPRGGRFGKMELGSGMTAELLGGIAGLALGILSLLGLVPLVLAPVAAIVFGAALVVGLGAISRLNDLQVEKVCDDKESRHIARTAVRSAEGVQMLIGLGSATLGILAVIGVAPAILSLVAMLAVGLSSLLSGSAVGGRMLHSLRCS
jgi:hypothetical protein